MDIELKNALDAQKAAIDAAVEKYDGQMQESKAVTQELKDELKSITEKYDAQLKELAQKQDKATDEAEKALSPGEQLVKSDAFKSLVTNQNGSARIEVKNTVLTDATNTFVTQRQGIIKGAFEPITLRSIIPTVPVTSSSLVAIREKVWANNAKETAQGAQKPESDITFENYNVIIETVAHWIKVSKQLLADAPAIAAYINVRLRDGLDQRIERQLLVGDGVSPNISGLTDAGNFTAFTGGADLIASINKAKYALWAAGEVPDTVVVNPADWGAVELSKGTDGHYLYGVPGFSAGMNPFGLNVVLNPHMPTGFILVGNIRGAATIYQRETQVVEAGFVNDDFTRNLITLRAEERLGLGVDRPAAIYYGDHTV